MGAGEASQGEDLLELSGGELVFFSTLYVCFSFFTFHLLSICNPAPGPGGGDEGSPRTSRRLREDPGRPARVFSLHVGVQVHASLPIADS